MNDKNEQLLDVSIKGKVSGGLTESGIKIQETDIKLSFKYDTLWDECIPFDFNDPPIDPEKLSMAMVTFMRDNGGVGLATNQLGYNFRMFVTEGEPAFAVFNPTITFTSPNIVLLHEGCLSFPHLLLKINRPSSIRVRFQDPFGNWVIKQFAGMSARVFQHEYDHLNGVDFTDKVSKIKLQMAQKKVSKMLKLERDVAHQGEGRV